jgi:hypothetical protein
MWACRVAQPGLVLILVLASCSSVGGDDAETAATLTPAQLGEDVDFLFRQMETIHPNVSVNISEGRYAKIQKDLCDRCGRPLTLQGFHGIVTKAVDSLGEGHTLVHPLLGKTPGEQKKAVQMQLDELLTPAGVSRNSYELLADRKVCVLRYESCGLPRDRPQYEAFFAKMFAEMRENDIKGLVVDLRKNGGGDSGTGNLLIRYLAHAPFRQYEQVAKRLTPQALAFYKSIGIDYMSLLKEGFDTSSLALDPNGVPVQKDFTVEARFVDPADEPFRFTGPVCVLIGRGTYSSAALFASTVQYYGLATLVGEETLPFVRGRQHCGDVVFVSLPHSQITVQISTAVFTVMRADKQKSARIVPDHKVVQSNSDTDHKVDTVQTFALDMLEAQLRESGE